MVEPLPLFSCSIVLSERTQKLEHTKSMSAVFLLEYVFIAATELVEIQCQGSA